MKLSDEQIYLQPSPYEADGGHLIGRLPSEISIEDLRKLGHPEKQGSAIRAFCLDCCCGNAAEVRKCVATRCKLWPQRMGKNPFYGKIEERKPRKLTG